jgi:prepilin-type N-terminal cleavage/methylation domain-containing protein
MLIKLNQAFEKSRREDGFTLIELLIVIVIIGILAGIAIPIFLNQQKAAVKATVKSDVHNVATNAALSLNDNPYADGFVGLLTGQVGVPAVISIIRTEDVNIPDGMVGLKLVISKDNVIKVSDPVPFGDDPTAGVEWDGDGSWNGYQITGTNPAVPGYYYTFNSALGKSWEGDN